MPTSEIEALQALVDAAEWDLLGVRNALVDAQARVKYAEHINNRAQANLLDAQERGTY